MSRLSSRLGGGRLGLRSDLQILGRSGRAAVALMRLRLQPSRFLFRDDPM